MSNKAKGPQNFRELSKVLLNLGFRATNFGKGSHTKFMHDEATMSSDDRCSGKPPFITLPKKCKFGLIKAVIKDLECFGFTEEQIVTAF